MLSPLRGLAAALLFIVVAHSPGQMQLTTTFAAGNGQNGNMFDLQATGGAPLSINSFDIHTASTGITVEVYVVTAGTSYVGNETNAAAWTMIASVTPVNGAGVGVGTPLNLALNYNIQPGQPVGFYVTGTSGTLSYTNGTTVGAPYASDAFLTVYEGVGKAYPFGATFTPRVWNGTVHYGLSQNQLDITQNMSNDLIATLTMLSPTAVEGFTFLSFDTSAALGQGPFFGLTPDATTWTTFTAPYIPSSPIHFLVTDPGWPNMPLVLPGASVAGLTGTTMDVVILFTTATLGYDSRSNQVRYTFL